MSPPCWRLEGACRPVIAGSPGDEHGERHQQLLGGDATVVAVASDSVVHLLCPRHDDRAARLVVLTENAGTADDGLVGGSAGAVLIALSSPGFVYALLGTTIEHVTMI